MALRAVLDHPKFKRLMRTLKLTEYRAMGVLETTWHFTGRFTPQGNIGKYSDEEIESWVGWDGETGAMVAALVKCGWLDVSQEHRLVVHDYHVSADPATKMALRRAGTDFVTRPLGESDVLTVSEQCRNGVSTVLGLPGPGPEPGPGPGPGKRAVRTSSEQGATGVSPTVGPDPEPAPKLTPLAEREDREAMLALRAKARVTLAIDDPDGQPAEDAKPARRRPADMPKASVLIGELKRHAAKQRPQA